MPRFLIAPALVFLAVMSGHSPAFCQESAEEFYGSPAPADFPQEEGVPIDDYAAALEMSESLSSGGVFEQKPYSFSLAVREGYDDNLFTTETNRYGSFYTNLAGGIEYEAGTPRFSLTAGLNGGVTYYYTRPGNQFDYTGGISLDGAYQLTPRLTLTFSTNTAYLAQPDLTIAGGTNRQNGDYFYSATTIGGAYQWTEKFSTETKYTLTPLVYVESALNNSQGRIDQTAAQSFNWLVLPKTTAVLEYRANAALYYSAPSDNFGQYFLLGVDQIFNPRFKALARAGVEYRTYTSSNDNPDYFGPAGELIAIYDYKKFSNLSLNVRYSTEQSGIEGSATRQTFRIGFNAVHGFTPKLSLNAGLNYLNNYYNEFNKGENLTNFYENIIEFTLGANFKLSDHFVLQGGYARTSDIAPSDTGLSYQRNVYFVGLNSNF